MSDRRVLVIAPTYREAEGEADELGIRRGVVLASNGNPYALRGVTARDEDIVRVREEGWSDELRSMVDAITVQTEPGVQT